MPYPRLRPLALTLLLAVGLPLLAAPADPEREEFGAVCDRARQEWQWYGRALADRLTRQLASFQGPAIDEVRLRGRLGVELTKLGETAKAIETLNSALERARVSNVRDPAVDRARWFLGMAYQRLAETENCVRAHTTASCVLPILPEGVHSRPEAARKAGDVFIDYVADHPRDIQTAWLAALSRMLSGDYPQKLPDPLRLPENALAPEVDDFPRWIDRAPELGVNVFDLAGGAVMDDFDGDGWLDLVTTTWDPCDGMKAFRNNGDGTFGDVTRAWGLQNQWGGLNLVHADFDNDGRLDLLVLRGGWMMEHGHVRNSLLRNALDTPQKRFLDVTRAAGLAEPSYPTQTAAWADYDGDGDLDLYVGNESTGEGRTQPSQLFRNNGDRTFSDVAAAAGVFNRRYAKSVAWGDYDDDGDPDLYVSNIGPNRLYRNNGDGTFADVAVALEVQRPEGRSFTSWFFDMDNDGDLDLFVSDYSSPIPRVTASLYGLPTTEGQPLLYRNDGGRFKEVSRASGLVRPALPMGANYGDLDNDGWLDVYLGTGEPRYDAVMPNLLFRNRGGTFQEITFASGLGQVQKGHGVAFGDLDNDGDQDLFHQLGGFYPGDAYFNALFENPGPPGGWLTLRLVGSKANRFGIGARIELRLREGERSRSVHRVAGSGGSFGGSSLQQEIGLGRATRIEEVVIRWPGSGRVDRFRGVAPGRVYRAVEGAERLEPVEQPAIRLGHAGPAAGGGR